MATVTSSKRQLTHTSNTYESNGDVTIGGNLNINGTTTTIDTANLLVEDKNIIIGDVSSPSDSTADGGGITLKGASDKTINWVNSTDSWTSNQRFSAPNLTLTGLTTSSETTALLINSSNQVVKRTLGSNAFNSTSFLTGNQTITLSGDVSGSGTTSISVTVADDSHNHIISNVDGLQSALDGKLGSAEKATDSNLLDNIDSTRFIYGDTATGTTSISGSAFNPTGSLKSGFYRVAGTSSTIPNATSVNFVLHTSYDTVGNKAGFDLAVNDSQSSKIYFRPSTGGGRGSWQTIWTDANDGSGSGLDADLLDGYNAEEGAVNNSIVKRDGTASIKAFGLSLLRESTARTGITWYNESYYNWQDYMASAGATGCGPNGNLTAPTGLAGVTSWALRSRMEGIATYGWNWETGGSGGGGATATSKMSLNATTGNLEIAGTFKSNTISAAASDTDKFLVSDSGLIKYRTGAQVLSDIGAASSSHTHAASNITSGTLATARIPSLAASKITSGTLDNARLDTTIFRHRGTLDLTSSSGGNNSLPFDDAHTETKVAEYGTRALSYTGASATMLTINTGGSASVFQIGAHYNGNDFYMRVRTDSSNWKTWKKLWHAGNDGSGSGLDADTLDGSHASAFAAAIDGTTSIWNADGDGDVFTYNDSNPTHNSKGTGAVIYIRGDGTNDHSLVRAGIFTSDHVSTANGYYVGTLLGTGNSTTTQVINGSGEWTGNVIPAAKLSTATTQSSNDNSTKIATTAYVQTEIGDLIGGAPAALDTLNELAAAIGDDASYASSITTALAAKAPLASPALTGAVTVTGSGSSGNVFEVKRGSDSAQVLRIQNTGEVVINNNYLYAASSGNSLYVQNGAIFRGSISNDTSGQPVTIGDDLYVSSDLTIGSGSSQSNLHIKKADNDVSDHIVFYNGTTRVGEIGVEDTTWLRINQETAKNIYTPRYIRADGGFFVDGASKGIDGSGNFIGGTITGASDANVSNWNTAYGWGNHASAGYLTTSGKAADSQKLDNLDSLRFPYALTGSLGSTNTFVTDGGIGADNITRSMFYRDNGNQFGTIGFNAQHATSTAYSWQMASTSYSDASAIQARVKNNGTWTSPVTIWNSGNDGSGSGLDADTTDGLHVHNTQSTQNSANAILRTQANGYTKLGWIETTSGNNNTAAISRIYASSDSYIRYYTPANFGAQIGSHISYNDLTNKPTIPSAYSLPLSSSSTRGGVKIGFSESGKNYPVELDSSEKMFVNVPWTDTNTNTTYSAGTGISLSGTTFSLTDTASKLSLSGGTMTGTLNSRDIKFANGYHLTRSNHSSGHLEGSYNNVGANGDKSNPIYTIGSSYNPTDAALSNMYGIGYCNASASFISLTGASSWGQYVAADGDARIWLGGTNGVISSTGEHYVGSNRVHHNGYHPNADTLTTARTIALGGDVTGSASFNGGSNITISASLSSGSVGASEIAANAVGSSEIATNAVTSAKIAADAVGASEIAASAVGASELNVSGNGSTSQFLRSDGDGTFTWATPTDTNTNTTYSAGRGLDLSGTEFQLETDLRDSISYIGYDSNDYVQWSNNSYFRSVVNGSERFRVNTSGIDVNGTTTSSGFLTDTSSTQYNLLTRNHSSNTLYVQAAQSGSTQGIATFRYGSTTANAGTEVLAVRRNSSYFVNTKLGVGTTSPSTALHVSGTITHTIYNATNLPSASPAGQRAFAYSFYPLATSHGSVVSTNGSYVIPVYSDGSSWRAG